MSFRTYSFSERCITAVDTGLKTLSKSYQGTSRKIAFEVEASPLTLEEKRHSASLMRVNYSGEVCAQALYQAQALMTRSDPLRASLWQAAKEEEDHLLWCQQRLSELEAKTSYFDPVWYVGSFLIGTLAGIAGDRWNLGFLEETENQVERHLKGHLERCSKKDNRTQSIVAQMAIDEAQHAQLARQQGAANLPRPLKGAMKITALFMTTITSKV